MYCGDETGSFIGDIGSSVCRFGYGGEDNPKYVVPSYVSDKAHMATSSLSDRVAQQELESILRTPSLSSNEQPQQLEPTTDPNSFLCQGDMIENWDHLLLAWNTSMDILHAKDTLKHTSGGTSYSSAQTDSTTIDTTGATAGDGKCVHPILAVTPGMTHLAGYGPSYCNAQRRQQLTKYTEMLMENLEASAVFLAPAPMLSAFSFGRQTSLVVDIGAGGCRVTPVISGLILGQSQKRNGRGGDWLQHITWKALLEQKITPVPRYQLKQHNLNKSTGTALPLLQAKQPLFHKWAMQDLMYELMTDDSAMKMKVSNYEKEVPVPFLNPPLPASPSSPPPGSPTKPSSPDAMHIDSPGGNEDSSSKYQLPDGTTIDLNGQLSKKISTIPDLLFADILPFQSTSASSGTDTTAKTTTLTNSNDPLHKLIRESLLAVGDVDARKELANCITLVGSTSLIPNLDARLSAELSNLLPGFVKPKIVASRYSIERSYSSWIGGSILTSLGSFQQLWLSKTEYEEYGVTLSIQRFPS